MSNAKIFVLMAGLTALFIAIGGAIGGQSGITMALVLAVAINFISYYASSTIVLRMYGAKVVTEREAPDLYAVVDRLRQRASLRAACPDPCGRHLVGNREPHAGQRGGSPA